MQLHRINLHLHPIFLGVLGQLSIMGKQRYLPAALILFI